MSLFEHVPEAPLDPILGLPILYSADSRKEKINLGVGTYRTAEGKPWILPSVKEAEKELIESETSKEYAPIEGEIPFIHETIKLIFGSLQDRVVGLQTLGGIGALSLGGFFLKDQGFSTVALSTPTWPNHAPLFKKAGCQIVSYPYYNANKNGLDFEKTLDFFSQLHPHTIVVLQASCHNPTGFDFTKEQWKKISDLLLQKKSFPFFDIAYQGFGQGVVEDAFPIRYFIQQGHEFFVAVSFSKNFGLYGERVGALLISLHTPSALLKVQSQIKILIRSFYSNPPIHGSRIIAKILGSDTLNKAWQEELQFMRQRIKHIRKILVQKLSIEVPKKDFSFINHQQGLFSFLGLTENQVLQLRHEKGIYMPINGRINLAGINEQNLDYVVEAFKTVL